RRVHRPHVLALHLARLREVVARGPRPRGCPGGDRGIEGAAAARPRGGARRRSERRFEPPARVRGRNLGGMSIAATLVAADVALRQAVGTWRGRGAVPAAVVRPALQEQLIERWLAREPRLRRAVLAQLPPSVARDVDADVRAYADLLVIAAHVPPHPLAAYRVSRPRPPLELESYYREAEQASGIPWEVLAAINFVETDFG